MSEAPKLIRLFGGPYNGVCTFDLDHVVMRLGVYRPMAGGEMECGDAIYEPTEDRTQAFWLENRWSGMQFIDRIPF